MDLDDRELTYSQNGNWLLDGVVSFSRSVLHIAKKLLTNIDDIETIGLIHKHPN